MDITRQYESCPVTLTEPIPGGEPVRGVFKLTNKETSRHELQNFLTSPSTNFLMELGEDEKGKMIQLRFYFRRPQPLDTSGTLLVYVDVVIGGEQSIFGFVTAIDELDENSIQCSSYIAPTTVVIGSKSDREGKLVGNFRWLVSRCNINMNNRRYDVKDNMRIGITVTPLKFQWARQNPSKELQEEPLPLVKISKQDFRQDCVSVQFNLKLESRDKFVFRVHKSILSAQSSVLKTSIEQETKNADSGSEVLKLDYVDGKPLRLILQWLYTNDFDEDEEWEGQLAEVLEAAKIFKMSNFLHYMDEKLVNLFCENGKKDLEHLYKIAKRYELSTTMEYIESIKKA